MARPIKQGMDYYPLDVDIDQDDKMQMIIGSFGYKGEAIYVKLLAWIYKNRGYYIEWNEMEQLKFATRVSYITGGAQVNLCKEVVAGCIKWGLFDSAVFNSVHILTSKRIQATWFEATRKRKDRLIDERIWLINIDAGNKAEETRLIPDVTTQSKVNEIKVNETKLNETKGEEYTQQSSVPAYTPFELESFKQFNEWIMINAPRVATMKEPFTIKQYLHVANKYVDQPGEIRTLLSSMHNWLPLHKKNQSAYVTLLNWKHRDDRERK